MTNQISHIRSEKERQKTQLRKGSSFLGFVAFCVDFVDFQKSSGLTDGGAGRIQRYFAAAKTQHCSICLKQASTVQLRKPKEKSGSIFGQSPAK